MRDRFTEKADICEPSADEALRLALAFYCIMEPEKRAIVLALAERYANEPNSQGGALISEEKRDGT